MLWLYILTGVLSTIIGFGTLAGESLWLLTPHNNSAKLAGRSQINNIYGTMCGLKNMNYIDGVMGVCIMAPMIVSAWMFSSPTAAIVGGLTAGAAGPFLLAVGLFIALIPPMGGVTVETAYVFAVFALILGAVTVFRCSVMPAEYVNVVVAWHVFCMVIAAVYSSSFTAMVPKLKHTMKDEKMKDDFVTAGNTWVRGEGAPVNFVGDSATTAAAKKELDEASFTPLWRFLLETVVILGALGAALCYPPSGGTVAFMYVPLATSAFGSAALVYATMQASKGGLGKQEVLDMI
jgi:hypothetical protein